MNELKKQLCDEAIVEGKLDEFFLNGLLEFSRNFAVSDLNEFREIVETLGALILRDRYELHIDDLLEKNKKYADTCQLIIRQLTARLDQIDLFFEQFYRRQKTDYLSIFSELKPFFADYHRRDLKQDAMLRAFIIVRNRILKPHQSELDTHGVSIVYVRKVIENSLITEAYLKVYMTHVGIQQICLNGLNSLNSLREQVIHEWVASDLQVYLSSKDYLESEFHPINFTQDIQLELIKDSNEDENNVNLQKVLKIRS